MANEPTIDKAALEACPWCGLTEHLSVRAEGSYTPDMPARPYRVVCNHIDHDTVEGPIGYGRKGATAAWNRRASPTTSPQAPEGVRDEVLEEAAQLCDAEADKRFAQARKADAGDTSWGVDLAASASAQDNKAITARALGAAIRALKGNRT